MPKNLTPELVKEFYKDLTVKYDAKVASKSDSQFMQLVSKFLDGLGIIDKKTFMERFTTTIGECIYTPFIVGVDGSSGYGLWNQVAIGTHECVHVQQYHGSPAGFSIRYLLDKSDRATFESEAYSADLQLYWWDNQQGYDLKERSKSLLNYGLGQEYCDYMEQYLIVRNDVFSQGGKVNDIATWAEEWLDSHGVIPNWK